MLIQFLADYLKHRLKAKSRHGTHSPFVYKLVDEVIYDFSAKKVYQDTEKRRKKLLDDDSRQVNKRLARLIYRIVNNHPARTIFGLGTISNLISEYISSANPVARIVTKGLEQSQQIDIGYLNGNRSKEETLTYFECCLPNIHTGTLLIINDIYGSRGMKEAWEEIKANHLVTVTIDLFWLGLVYFKKDQVKEHFKIKI